MSPFRSAGEHQTSELSVHPADFGEAPLPRLPHRDDHLADRPACDAAELWMCLGERKADSRCRQRDGPRSGGRAPAPPNQHHPDYIAESTKRTGADVLTARLSARDSAFKNWSEVTAAREITLSNPLESEAAVVETEHILVLHQGADAWNARRSKPVDPSGSPRAGPE